MMSQGWGGGHGTVKEKGKRKEGRGARWEGEESQAIVWKRSSSCDLCLLLSSHVPFPRRPSSR